MTEQSSWPHRQSRDYITHGSLVTIIKAHVANDQPVYAEDSLMRTIAEVDPDRLTSLVDDQRGIASFALTRDEIIQKLATTHRVANNVDDQGIKRLDGRLAQFWKSASAGLHSDDEVPSGEQLDTLFADNATIEQLKAGVEHRRDMITRLESQEFADKVEVIYQQQPMVLAQRIHEKRRELSITSRIIGTTAAFFAFGIGSASVLSTQAIRVDEVAATSFICGVIGGATGYVITSSPGSVARSAQKTAHRKLRRSRRKSKLLSLLNQDD